MKNEEIMNSHQWLRDLKASKKISNTELGDIIGYSNTGLGKALRKETLSYEQIRIIAIHYGLMNEFDNYFSHLPSVKNAELTSIEDIISDKVYLKLKRELNEIKSLLYKVLVTIEGKELKGDLLKELKKELKKPN